MQAEQVEDDVAPVTAEYVPAKASDKEYAYINLTSNVRFDEQMGAGTRFSQ
jgi:hypothetical protein